MKYRFYLPCLLLCLLAGVLSRAQQSQGMSVNGIIEMVQAGLADDVIITLLQKEQKPFDLSLDEMIRLKKAKVSDAVVKAMLDPKPTTGSNAQGVAAPPAFPGVRVPAPSGATPAPGAVASGDPNDPMTPHDSGIYLYTKDRDGNPQMILLERAAYQGAKTGGMLPMAMTYGLKKMKTKAVIPGPKANIRVADSSPIFYFYFDDKQAGLGKSAFGVGNLSNPNQFSLVKLEVNRSYRETTIGQFGTLGISTGTDSSATVPFQSERVRAGLYKVVVPGVKTGEYCFLASSGAGGVYAAAAMAATDIFDFGVNTE